MHLSLFINPTGHHQASWRHPRSQPDAGINFDHYRELALKAESACFDAIFLADNQAIRAGDPRVVSRVAQYVANFEPLTLASGLLVSTERIGVICTASTSYNLPYQVARKFASMDHLSHGRVGWNIVTSGMQQEAWNFGREEHYEHELRYERAAEFVEVCKGLWDSWEDDAFPRDAASGIFSDADKLHVLGHAGEHFQVRGPLNIPRPPQGYPVFVQAGASPTGTAFAARYAERVFGTARTIEEGRLRRQAVRDQGAALGRNPDHVKVMPGLAVIVGATQEQAEEERARLESLLDAEVALNLLQIKMGGFDLSGFDLDLPLPLDGGPSETRGYYEKMAQISVEEGLTLRQLAQREGGLLAGIVLCGTGSMIVDVMEQWVRSEAADGFNLMPAFLPGALDDFIEQVVPELRRRGLLRERYEGATLRDHLGLPRPAWRPAGAG
jgi:FMN-dependent oxidoreductase (nitrilotriacetate monooxygenase family)